MRAKIFVIFKLFLRLCLNKIAKDPAVTEDRIVVVKHGVWSLLTKLLIDSFAGFLIVFVVALPAIIIKVCLGWLVAYGFNDQYIVPGLYIFAYYVFALDFAVAMAIVTRLGMQLIREVFR
jgi:hypothetical protein